MSEPDRDEFRVLNGADYSGKSWRGKYPDAGEWIAVWVCAAWRKGDGPVSRGKLVVELATGVADPAGVGTPPSSSPYRQLRVRGAAPVFERDRLRLFATTVERLEPLDPDLTSVAEDLKNPVVVQHAPFGKLLLDRALGLFEGGALWRGSSVRLLLGADEDGTTAKQAAKLAQALWRSADDWDAEVRAAAVEQLLSTWRTAWREDAPDLDEASFAARLALRTVEVHPDHRVEFWFEDDGLFSGHHVVVRRLGARGPWDVVVAG